MERTLKNKTTPVEAISKTIEFLQGLLNEKFSDGTSLSKLRKSQQNGTLYFSFERKDGGLSATWLSGSVLVTDSELSLNLGFFSPIGSDTTVSFSKFRLEIANKFEETLSSERKVTLV